MTHIYATWKKKKKIGFPVVFKPRTDWFVKAVVSRGVKVRQIYSLSTEGTFRKILLWELIFFLRRDTIQFLKSPLISVISINYICIPVVLGSAGIAELHHEPLG